MTETTLQEIDRVAVNNPEQLKRWLQETNRVFVLLKSTDLVDALPWPDGVSALIHIIECYRQHRITIPVEYAPCPKLPHRKSMCELCKNTGEVVARNKDQILEVDEMKEAVIWLINQIHEKHPTWNPFLGP
jgi:hypothetical protein